MARSATSALPNEIGVIILRGPNVFPGYSDEFHNQGLFVEGGDGAGKWLNTGDLGRIDEDGYIWLTGRKKELIVRSRHNIDPRLIEEALHGHPAVALAAAVGRPDHGWARCRLPMLNSNRVPLPRPQS